MRKREKMAKQELQPEQSEYEMWRLWHLEQKRQIVTAYEHNCHKTPFFPEKRHSIDAFTQDFLFCYFLSFFFNSFFSLSSIVVPFFPRARCELLLFPLLAMRRRRREKYTQILLQ